MKTAQWIILFVEHKEIKQNFYNFFTTIKADLFVLDCINRVYFALKRLMNQKQKTAATPLFY